MQIALVEFSTTTMKFRTSVVPFLAVLASAMAFSISSRAVYLDGNELITVNEPSNEVHEVSIVTPKDVLAVAVRIEGESRPHQLVFLFSDGQGLDYAVYPDYNAGSQIASSKLPIAKLPDSLKSQDKVTFTVVAADSSEEENIAQPLFELVFSEDLKKAIVSPPVRLGPKPEIHHIFRGTESTVNAIVPVVFSAVALVLLVALLGGWSTTLSGSLFRALDGGAYKTAFVAVLATLEYTFVKYYLGATIFTTLFHVAILAGPGLLLGLKALNALAKLHAA